MRKHCFPDYRRPLRHVLNSSGVTCPGLGTLRDQCSRSTHTIAMRACPAPCTRAAGDVFARGHRMMNAMGSFLRLVRAACPQAQLGKVGGPFRRALCCSKRGGLGRASSPAPDIALVQVGAGCRKRTKEGGCCAPSRNTDAAIPAIAAIPCDAAMGMGAEISYAAAISPSEEAVQSGLPMGSALGRSCCMSMSGSHVSGLRSET